jgi:6-phosphogluconolactonase
MYRFLFILFLMSFFISCKNETDELTDILVGTYTKNMGFVDGKGEGIYQLRINLTKGVADSLKLLQGGIENPSYVRKAGNYYLSVSEVAGDDYSPYGRVNILNKDLSGGRSFVTYGTSPCHIGISPAEDVFGVANYNGGAVVFYTLDKNSEPLFPQKFFFSCTKSEHPRQDASHMHSVLFSPDGKFIVAADLGCDSVRVFEREGNTIIYQPENSIQVSMSCGPRHTDWSKDGKILAVSCELSSSVETYKYENGKFLKVSSVSTLPENYNENNTVSDIHFHPNGKFIYSANRGHNSIAAFSINENGNLKPLGQFLTKGKTPRNFMITKDGKFMLAGNQDSDNITLFKISENGTLVFINQIECKTPVCLEQI